MSSVQNIYSSWRQFKNGQRTWTDISQPPSKKGERKRNTKRVLDNPGGRVAKNPLANAGDMGLIPGSGFTCHRTTKLCATNIEACMPKACAPQHKRSHCNEKPAHCNKSSPTLQQLQKAQEQKRPSTAKN